MAGKTPESPQEPRKRARKGSGTAKARKPRSGAAKAGKKAPRLKGVRNSALLQAIEDAYGRIASEYVELKKADAPVFMIQSNPRMTTLGHFAAGRWSVTEKAKKNGKRTVDKPLTEDDVKVAVAAMQDGKDAAKAKVAHEIVIVAEGLKRGPADVFETVLHEAVHARGHLMGVATTSMNGRYHNQRFAMLAQEMGLAVSRHASLGYAITALTKDTEAKYKAEIKAIAKALQHTRNLDLRGKTKVRDRNNIKAVCGCDRIIRVSRTTLAEGGIICTHCEQEFMPEDE